MSTDERGIFFKRNGVWKQVIDPKFNRGLLWKDLKSGYVKVNGAWQQFYPSAGVHVVICPGESEFQVPPGINQVTVNVTGGGGGGGGGTAVGDPPSAGGGGGSAGGVLGQVIDVVPNTTLRLIVGAGGAGAADIGETSDAPDGADGGDSRITGYYKKDNVTIPVYVTKVEGKGGRGGVGGFSVKHVAGGGGGGGGGKIICTKLFELGLMSEEIYLADQAFGSELVKSRPDIYNGYRAWAEIVVDWMDGHGPKMMPWMTDEQFSIAAMNWSRHWAVDIATPWAEEMAREMGIKDVGSLTGKMIMAAGIPVCKFVGMWQRKFGPSKKPTGFVKGAMLIAIFVMFKLVAEFGRLIEPGAKMYHGRHI